MKKIISLTSFIFTLSSFLFCTDFIFVKSGKFLMQENSKQEIFIDSFYICNHEVTQKEWKYVMGNNPSYELSDLYPVNMISWIDAIIYCNKRSILEGLEPCYRILDSKIELEYEIPWEDAFVHTDFNEVICDWKANGYRLPTEAEWEYAAKSGGKENFYFSGSNNIDDVSWYYNYIGATIHAVMTKQPNSLGIYDMSGNVSEWCWDWYKEILSDNLMNPKGPVAGTAKIHRGGSWTSEVWEKSFDEDCSVSKRAAWIPTMKDNNLGFRVVRSTIKSVLDINTQLFVSENLKLRSGEATSTQVLTVMQAGTKVKILELGKSETIDGINSNWVKVEVQAGAKDRDGKPIKKGTVGWCYGGYLK